MSNRQGFSREKLSSSTLETESFEGLTKRKRSKLSTDPEMKEDEKKKKENVTVIKTMKFMIFFRTKVHYIIYARIS